MESVTLICYCLHIHDDIIGYRDKFMLLELISYNMIVC